MFIDGRTGACASWMLSYVKDIRWTVRCKVALRLELFRSTKKRPLIVMTTGRHHAGVFNARVAGSVCTGAVVFVASATGGV